MLIGIKMSKTKMRGLGYRLYFVLNEKSKIKKDINGAHKNLTC